MITSSICDHMDSADDDVTLPLWDEMGSEEIDEVVSQREEAMVATKSKVKRSYKICSPC